MKAKRFAIILAALTMLMGTAGMSAYANEEVLDTVEEAEVIEVLEEEEIEMFDDVAASVAKVGDTEYATIDEALANWTHNTTLTLLADVTLANTITLNSNEMHTLELGDFTMSTATGKTAIKFSVKGRGSAGTTLIINATADGGINAGTVINYSNTNKNLQDRSIIKVNGGTYNGNISINCPNNTNAAQLHITQGTFNGTISGRSPLVLISGGVFNKKVSLSVASNSYAQITGGRFYDLYSDSDLTNKEKFFFGTNASARGDYSGVDVYVDSDGYYVVTKNIDNNKPENFEASVSADTIATKYNASTHWNGFKSNMGLFEYTKAINEGLFYKDAAMALTQNTLGTVILYTEADTNVKTSGDFKLDMTDEDANYTGNITFGAKNHTFTVVFDSDKPYSGEVTAYPGCALGITETMGAVVTRTYYNADAYAKISDNDEETEDVYYATFEEAISNVKNGETIILLKDIELSKSLAFAKDIEFTIDGNGKKITPAVGSTETNSVFNFGMGNDGTVATRKYTIKNVVFDGWTTDHVVRLQGVDATVENCTFINCEQTRSSALGLLTLTFCDARVTDCVFEDNTCAKAIDINSWGDDSVSEVVIDECTFTENTCTQNAVVLVSCGLSTVVSNSEFVDNTVNAAINGATLYLGFNTGIKAVGNYFEGNAVNIVSTAAVAARPYRSAGAIFAGFADENCAIEENAFIGNTLKLDDAQATEKAIAYSAYYGAGNLSHNYWGDTTEPVAGVDYSHEYATTNPVVIDDYYTDSKIGSDGNVDLYGLKYIVKDVKLEFEYASEKEDELIYNINITAPGKIINRLNSVDLTFVLAQEFGKNAYEIVSSNDEIVINPVNNSESRYEFHYNGKTDVETDTAQTITIGQVKFTGYGKFTFAVKTNDTNVAHATKNDDNIVDTFVPGGNEELGYGVFDVTNDNAVVDDVIYTPTRDLYINIDFPNAILDNAYTYQQMKVVISGGDLDKAIVVDLGNDSVMPDIATSTKPEANVVISEDSLYQVVLTDALTVNTTYNVEVSGEGYRTARYSVTMNCEEYKTLNFWNNVKDNAVEVEEGKDSSKKDITFLAGDIVKDSVINIYDLSAVVSYFGEIDLAKNGNTKYAKYDLNRDGKIDSKDVAYVLVSWGK